MVEPWLHLSAKYPPGGTNKITFIQQPPYNEDDQREVNRPYSIEETRAFQVEAPET